jgi:mono/diheme cytochrome c family protein/glucose/arabinose dehydrogenase
MLKFRLLISLFICVAVFIAANENGWDDLRNPSPALSANEELKTFQIEPNLEIELVAEEPLVQAPIALSFDEDGRLWVVEMRGYMSDIDGKGEKIKNGRVSVLEDLDGDGKMDKSTVYLDSLLLPRGLGLVKGGALVATDKALYLTKDLNGDLKADQKILLDSTYSKNGLPEHSDNGLLLNLDNWYYNTKSRLRYRFMNGLWKRDSTEFRGQWGISHDNYGRLFYNYNWSQLHADLIPANYLNRNKNHTISSGIDHGVAIDRKVYPVRPNPAVNRGYIAGVLDSKGSILEFTSACSPLILRSDLFPKSYAGNAFVCEPAGNLIKRNIVYESKGILSAKDAHPGKEFLASTDERFRPANTTQGPDGGLYIADMYRGIIQHGSYMTPYLKDQTLKRGLDSPVNMGRIWRVRPKRTINSINKVEKLSNKSSKELVAFLNHPSGWYRDMAQRLLVERQDFSIVQDLEHLLVKSPNILTKIHALWTLDGLNSNKVSIVSNLLDQTNSKLRVHALQVLDKIPNAYANQKLVAKLLKLSSIKDQELAVALALSAGNIPGEKGYVILSNTLQNYANEALQRDAVMSSLYNKEFDFLQFIWNKPLLNPINAQKEIFLELLASAILKKKNASEFDALVSFLEKQKNTDAKGIALVNSLAIQSLQLKGSKAINLSKEPEIFTKNQYKLGTTRLRPLLEILNWNGKVSQVTNEEKTLLDEKAMKQFALGRQKYLSVCSGCHGNDGRGVARLGPPLAGSEWVTGDELRLSLVVLHGMEGAIEVNGKKYDKPNILPVMPSHSTMDDGDIAAILTYIRNEWGNSGTALTGRNVGSNRALSQGRVNPWTPKELNNYVNAKRMAEKESQGKK